MRTTLVAAAVALLAACAVAEAPVVVVGPEVVTEEAPGPCLVIDPALAVRHCEGPEGRQHCTITAVCAACEPAIDGMCETSYGPTECLPDDACPSQAP